MQLSDKLSKEINNVEKLKRIAKNAGFLHTFDRQQGEQIIYHLLEAVLTGRAILVKCPDLNDLSEDEQQDLEFQLRLFARGLIRELRPLRNRELSPFEPIAVEGEPVSKMIIRERR